MSWTPVIEGIGFPEGPAVALDGSVVCTDAEAGVVVAADRGRTPRVVARVPERPLGTVLSAEGALLVARAEPPAVVILEADGSGQRVLIDGVQHGIRLVNDLDLAPDGSLYFTDTGAEEDGFRGALWRTDVTGTRVAVVAPDLEYANGVAVRAGVVYVAETRRRRILRVVGATGPDPVISVFAQMRGGVGPDGLAFGPDGLLYAAHYGAGTVRAFGPDGTEDHVIAAPGANPTNLAFASDGTLHLTEAETGALWALAPDRLTEGAASRVH